MSHHTAPQDKHAKDTQMITLAQPNTLMHINTHAITQTLIHAQETD